MLDTVFRKTGSVQNMVMLPMNLNNKSFRLEGDLLSMLNSDCNTKKTIVRNNRHHIYKTNDGRKGPTDYKSHSMPK